MTFEEFLDFGGQMFVTHAQRVHYMYTDLENGVFVKSDPDIIEDEPVRVKLIIPTGETIYFEDTGDPDGFALDFIMDGCPIDKVEDYQGRL